ncbi:DUF2953 domain-containing protein [Pelosinus sp. sgz500959]|uniref:DUF2953 domain-containing protein n=1 Tax=Pelosinus sp. sgz500959 TaxID=3242472 RepID=UPI00366EC0BD
MNIECWLLIILSEIIVTSLLLYTKIYLSLKCKRDGSNDYIEIEVYIMKGLLIYRMQVPIIEIIGKEKSLWVESEIRAGEKQDKTHTKREQRFIKEKFKFYLTHPKKLRRIVKKLRYYIRLYDQMMKNIIKALHCERLYWKTSYGSEDAALTGIMSGMLWTIKALLLTNLEKQVVFRAKPVIHVHPIFGHNHFEVDFQCIFSIRLGNVITAMRSLYSVK